MDLVPGLAVSVTQGDSDPVKQLQTTILSKIEKLVMTRHKMQEGLLFWGQNLYAEKDIEQSSQTLEKTKVFIESLQAYNTPGKLKNLKCEADEILAHKEGLEKLTEIEELEAFVLEISQIAQYFSFSEGYLPENDPWIKKNQSLREKILKDIKNPDKRKSTKFKATVMNRLKELKKDYIKTYMAQHKKVRLTHSQDKAKSDLTKDYRISQLQKLTSIDLLNRQQLIDFQDDLGKLKTCFALTEKDLANDPKCPHCGFWPSMEASKYSADAKLQELKTNLDKIQQSWTQSLLNNLDDPSVQNNFSLLKAKQQKILKEFTDEKELPDEISSEFIQAIQEVLAGLSKISVKTDNLKAALFPDGSPATPAEFKERFDQFVKDLLKGKDAGKVRIVID